MVVREGDALCRQFYSAALALGNTVGVGTTAYYERLIPLDRKTLRGLRRLGTPDSDARVFGAVLAADTQIIKAEEQLVRARRHGRSRDVVRAERQQLRWERVYVMGAKTFGFKVCGTQE
jgi:hypothetical protein